MTPLFFLVIRPVSLPTLRDFSGTALPAAVRFCVASRVGWLQALVIVRGTGKGFSGSGPSRVVGEPSFCVTVFSVCGAGGCLRAARKFFGGLFTVNRACRWPRACSRAILCVARESAHEKFAAFGDRLNGGRTVGAIYRK